VRPIGVKKAKNPRQKASNSSEPSEEGSLKPNFQRKLSRKHEKRGNFITLLEW